MADGDVLWAMDVEGDTAVRAHRVIGTELVWTPAHQRGRGTGDGVRGTAHGGDSPRDIARKELEASDA